MFGSLHTRSHFSFLDGASSPEDLVATAARMGYRALALTDWYGVYGAVRLERACRDYHIKPIMGCDVAMNNVSISILARSQVGYQQICNLLTEYYQDGHQSDALRVAQLDDCICIVHGTGHELICVRDVVTMLSTHRVYVGIAHDARPWSRLRTSRLVGLARELDTPIVIAQDVRYATADCYAVHDLMTCIREGVTIYDAHPLRAIHDKHCLRSEQDLHDVLPYPDAFENVRTIIDECSFIARCPLTL